MAVLLDTDFLFSFYNTSDKNHLKTMNLMNNILDGRFGKPYILDYVFDELLTLVQTRSKNNNIATQIGNQLIKLIDANKIGLLLTNINTFETTWKIFANQTGRKYLSFTDAMLISTARILQINYIASYDSLINGMVSTISQ